MLINNDFRKLKTFHVHWLFIEFDRYRNFFTKLLVVSECRDQIVKLTIHIYLVLMLQMRGASINYYVFVLTHG
jgi:hypothetical protein